MGVDGEYTDTRRKPKTKQRPWPERRRLNEKTNRKDNFCYIISIADIVGTAG
jgi:hypothetical protein